MKRLSLTVAALGLLATAAFAQGTVESGPRSGQAIQGYAFQVVDVNGPNKGKQLCYY